MAPDAPLSLAQYTMYSILFVLPIAYAGSVFGVRWGLVTPVLALVAMLPRAIFISPAPGEAVMEVTSVIFVGGLAVLFFSSQQRERRRRLEALSELGSAQEQLKQHIQAIEKNQQRLATLNAVSSLVSQFLELQQVLNMAVDSHRGHGCGGSPGIPPE